MDSASIVADTARRILADTCDPQTVNRAANDGWKVPAWRALETAGLPLAWVPEALGGAGGEMADGFAVLREAGRFAAPLPLSETLLAGWLLAQADISAPPGAMTCGPTRDGDKLTLAANGMLNGRLRAIAFARDAKHLALLVRREQGGAAIALVETAAARLADGASLAGDPLNAVTLGGVRPIAVRDAPGGVDENALLLMGAAVRSVTMAGALESILDITVSYANERVAFERPIAKFQAVQHNLARLAGETAAAIAAAGSAADAIAEARAFDEGVFLDVASAKIRVGEAAGEGAGIGHQVMGAIGFTQEHILHRFTRRLWSWRDDFGNESYWAARLGAMVAARGADGLWPMLADR
jgi:acyl-CoA dehydrogenase